MSVVLALMLVALGMAVAGAQLAPEAREALATAKNLYVATKRADGSTSKVSPIWFMVDGDAIYFTTVPTSYKAKRIAKGSPLLIAEVPAMAVVPGGTALAARLLPPGLEFLGRAETLVRPPGGQQVPCRARVDLEALRLSVRAERASHIRPLVPVQVQPAQRAEESAVER